MSSLGAEFFHSVMENDDDGEVALHIILKNSSNLNEILSKYGFTFALFDLEVSQGVLWYVITDSCWQTTC